jgi:hypothetical protein
MNSCLTQEGSEEAMDDRRKSSGSTIPPLSTGGDRAPYHVAPEESLFDRMTRDLHAWRLAKGVIEKAKARQT